MTAKTSVLLYIFYRMDLTWASTEIILSDGDNIMCAETKTTSFRRLAALFFFSAAFAYIEAVVVVYLRAIFYPDGFNFPIANLLEMPGAATYLLIEIGREAATVVLMFTASYLMVRKFRQRLAYFLIIFAVIYIFVVVLNLKLKITGMPS